MINSNITDIEKAYVLYDSLNRMLQNKNIGIFEANIYGDFCVFWFESYCLVLGKQHYNIFSYEYESQTVLHKSLNKNLLYKDLYAYIDKAVDDRLTNYFEEFKCSYLTLSEYAQKNNVSVDDAIKRCERGKVKGAHYLKTWSKWVISPRGYGG